LILEKRKSLSNFSLPIIKEYIFCKTEKPSTMNKILVIYYTQSGQLKKIIDSTLSPMTIDDNFEIDYLKLIPEKDYPFPWGNEFFNCFPESVKGIPCKMTPYNIDTNKQYDLVILGYQPWFLSPSIPIWSFLDSKEASILLKDKNTITIVGARNMWAGAQEIIKHKLVDLKANLVGNIVLQDRADNILSTITIIRWLIDGKKEATPILPEAGISQKDISNSEVFGKVIKDQLNNKKLNELQPELLKNKAVQVKFHLLNIEMNGRKIFCKFADLALKQKNNNRMHREKTINKFKAYLLFAIFLLSPIFSLIFITIRVLLFPIANKKLDYYANVKL
jgi:hypothetical protein